MKIHYNGVTIEDISYKESIGLIKALTGNKIKTNQPGMFKLPKEVIKGKKKQTSVPWTREELLFLINNVGKKGKILREAEELSARTPAAIMNMRIKFLSKNKKKMGEFAYGIAQEAGYINLSHGQ